MYFVVTGVICGLCGMALSWFIAKTKCPQLSFPWQSSAVVAEVNPPGTGVDAPAGTGGAISAAADGAISAGGANSAGEPR